MDINGLIHPDKIPIKFLKRNSVLLDRNEFKSHHLRKDYRLLYINYHLYPSVMKIPPLVTLSWSSFSKVSMGNQPTNPPCSGFLPFNGNQVTCEILPQETSRWTSQTMEGAINESLPNKFSPRNLQRLQTRKAFGLIGWKISWWFHQNFTSSKSLVGVSSITYLEYV